MFYSISQLSQKSFLEHSDAQSAIAKPTCSKHLRPEL